MDNFKFVKTDDNSTGLFDNSVNDIYHSRSGAKKEAIDKFIKPIIDTKVLDYKKCINVLDICYGIGYNTKTFINEFYDRNVYIDCLEIDKNLIAISPLIKDEINNIKIKIELLYEVIKLFADINLYYDSIKKYLTEENLTFFDADMLNLVKKLISDRCNFIKQENKSTFLHNIYYRYISDEYNYAINYNKNNKISMNFLVNDARMALKSTNCTYDIVFIDAFSPQKDPTLWTIDFINLIKQKIHKDTLILTYSKSTAVRNTFKQLDFYVGKTFIDSVDMGSIFSLNKDLILYPLNEFDIGLLSTTSGIPYRDSLFSLTAAQIIENRNFEQKFSNLVSHTQFLKNYR